MRFSKAYKFIQFLLSMVFGICILEVNSVAFGISTPYTWWGFILVLAEILVLINMIYRALHRRLVHKIKGDISVYEDDCDPDGSLLLSDKVAKTISPPYNAWDIWFLSYRCLAYYSLGEEDIARGILQDMLDDISKATKGDHRAAFREFSVFPALASIEGRGVALEYIKDVEAFFMQDPKKYSSKLSYISEQREIALAEESGDPALRISVWRKQRKREDCSLRAKVVAAFHEAEGHREAGETEEELALLRYVAEHGSKLRVGRIAVARLSEVEHGGANAIQ